MSLLKKYLLYVLMVFLIMGACTSEKSYKVLTFFFDGVPERFFSGDSIQSDTILNMDSTVVQTNPSGNHLPNLFLHQPYANKECNTCHNSGMGQVLMKQPQLCYSCHRNYENDYASVHGPVASGYCTTCHNPHKSEIDHLLVREDPDICLHCHDIKQVENNPIHQISDLSSCTECHDPHGEENTYLLKIESCYTCHEDYSKSFTYVHGPVAGGFCNSCHGSHTSESEYKLLYQGQDLCYKCHQKENVLKNDYHEDSKEFNCLECHHPHGGEDRLLLR
jgi:predicted CXXCH cytochrome family protein